VAPVDTLFPREPAVLRPGAVHRPDWIDLDEQRYWLDRCRTWARPPAGLRQPSMPDGKRLSVRSVCLGWHWYPYAYSRTVDDGDGAPVKPFPADLHRLARRAVADTAAGVSGRPVPCVSGGPGPGASAEARAGAGGPTDFDPDAAIINWYDQGARLGLHQDGVETAADPVVTVSLGDDCLFRLGGDHSPNRPWHDVRLHSGDLLVFGGPARLAFHGVVRIFPETAPPELGMKRGRISITVRRTGLS
jgi:alkylated DNA repair protein (DNA oxidative demethylase)